MPVAGFWESGRIMVSLGHHREQSLGTAWSASILSVAWQRRPGLVFCSCALAVAFSLVLGGGTRGGFLSDAILELIAVPTLLVSLWSLIELPWGRIGHERQTRRVMAFCCAIVLLPLLQLIPLPPWIWTKLPGRENVETVFAMLGQSPWMPISVSPVATWLSFLSLLAPLGIFLGTVQLSYRERRAISLIIVAIGVISAFLGLLQVAQGPASSLRFFVFTNDMDAVGFFANRNHLAALMYTALLFTAVWAIEVTFKEAGSLQNPRGFGPRTVVVVTAAFLALLVLLLGEIMARSRAGVILTMVALAAIFALASADRRNGLGSTLGTRLFEATPTKLLLAAIMLAVTLAVQFALYRILDRFTVDPLADARIPFARNTFRAALAFMPFGAGLGTFVQVYQMFESPSDLFPRVYANHAHNDVLELWLETGVAGMVLAAAFVTWVGSRLVRIWRQAPAGGHEIDHSLARAAVVAVGLLLAHSLVDYPLRTGAIMAIFAFSCALLIEPLATVEISADTGPFDEQPTTRREKQKTSLKIDSRRSGAHLPPEPNQGTAAAAQPKAQPRGRWGEDIEWPEAWRNANAPKKEQL